VASPPPRYPPLAVGDAIVLVEVLVGLDGRVREAQIISGASGFHEASLDAAQGWLFRPARWNAQVVESYAYLIFGFRAPIGIDAAAAVGSASRDDDSQTGRPTRAKPSKRRCAQRLHCVCTSVPSPLHTHGQSVPTACTSTNTRRRGTPVIALIFDDK
jgi:hypothetical protein